MAAEIPLHEGKGRRGRGKGEGSLRCNRAVRRNPTGLAVRDLSMSIEGGGCSAIIGPYVRKNHTGRLLGSEPDAERGGCSAAIP